MIAEIDNPRKPSEVSQSEAFIKASVVEDDNTIGGAFAQVRDRMFDLFVRSLESARD